MRKTTKRKYRRRKLGDGIKAALESDRLKRRTEPHKAPEYASMLKTVFRDGERFGKVEGLRMAMSLTKHKPTQKILAKAMVGEMTEIAKFAMADLQNSLRGFVDRFLK